MKFNRKKFYDGFRQWRKSINQDQVDGINILLDHIEKDKNITHLTWVAYMFATTLHETAYTMLPIREIGRGRGKAYAKVYTFKDKAGNVIAKAVYYGRGFVQLTWYDNYVKMNSALKSNYPDLVADFERRTGKKFNIVLDPDQVMDPHVAYAIMSYGMRNGSFTGKRLSQTLKGKDRETRANYKASRPIINRMDKADAIADMAIQFEKILRNSLESGIELTGSSQPTESVNEEVIEIEQPEETNSGEVNEQPGIEITDSDVSIDNKTEPVVSSDASVEIRKERPSTFSKIRTAVVTTVGGIVTTVTTWFGGSEIQNQLVNNAAQSADKSFFVTVLPLLLYITIGLIIGAFLIWLGCYIYDKSAERSNRLNQKNMDLAARTDVYTPKLVG